jgi:transcriptional regulator with XRE-family HTH domain
VKEHIYPIIAAQRRLLGLSQQDVAALAGVRREKINRVESRHEDVSLSDLARILDALDLKLMVAPKGDEGNAPGLAPAVPAGKWPSGNHALKPAPMAEASFIDGARAKVLKWGKVA